VVLKAPARSGLAICSTCRFSAQRGRWGTIPGKFTPAQDDAVALRDDIAQYWETADGVVPYGRWPAGVKGHFLVRVPPENFTGDCPVAILNADAVAT
jgi:predicted metal-binding protein